MNESGTTLIEITAWLSQNAVNLLLQSTVLILIGLLTARMLHRHGSAVQSAIYRATLVAVLACPLAAAILNQIGLDGWTLQLPETTRTVMVPDQPEFVHVSPPPSPSSDSLESTADSVVENLPVKFDSPPAITPATLVPPSETEATAELNASPPTIVLEGRMIQRNVLQPFWVLFYTAIGLLWLLGALLLLIRLYFAYCKLSAVRRRSAQAEASDHSLCGQIAERINVRAPDVRRNSLLASPCLTGIASPVILLPDEINKPLPLEKAFAHELAHLRRHDPLWNLIQRLALALFFFQPLMWRLIYRLETTAEEVCDDFVVRHCMDRAGYAEQLVALAESNLVAPNMAGLGMFKSNRSLLGRRVVRILDSTRKLTTHLSWPAIVGIIGLTMICATLGGFLGNDTDDKDRPEPVRETRTEDQESEVGADEEATVTLSGTVKDNEGNPVEGVRVYCSGGKYETTSGADGRFEFAVPESSTVGRHGKPVFFATKPGYGRSFCYVDADQHDQHEFTLPEDSCPIEGRLLDTEGNPVADARIRVTYTTVLKDVDAFLAAARKPNASVRDLPGGTSSAEENIAEVSTNEKGEFQISGIGYGRQVQLEVRSDRVAFQFASAITVDIEPISVYRAAGSMPMSGGKRVIHGHRLTLVGEPTQLIEGVVVDRDSGLPLAGIDVYSDRFANEMVSGRREIKTTTDEKGKFKLAGMPLGQGNTISAIPEIGPDAKVHYLPRDLDVPQGDGSTPVLVKIELPRGSLVSGKVIDRQSGAPVAGARVNWKPFKSDKLANEIYPDQSLPSPVTFLNETGPDGTFQFVALPGKSLIDVWVVQGSFAPYPPGQGWENVADEHKTEDGNIQCFGFPASRKHPTYMHEINVSPDADLNDLVFELDQGRSIAVKLVDADGQPVSGVSVDQARSIIDSNFVAESSEFQASGFLEGQQRTLTFFHKDRSIGLIQNIGYDTPSPVTITLQPNALVKAKLMDRNGDPVSGAQMRFDLLDKVDFFLNSLPQFRTNDEGYFERSIPPGRYRVSCESIGGFHTLYRELVVEPGKNLDFGTLNVHEMAEKARKERDEPKRTKANAVQQDVQDGVKFSGAIVDLNGMTVADASISSFGGSKAISAADGSFTITFSNEVLDKYPTGKPGVSIRKDGFGMSFAQLSPDDPAQKLVLVNDDHPIEGQLIDTEGNPVEGANIAVERVQHYDPGVLDAWLNEGLEREGMQSLPQGIGLVDIKIPAVKTDRNGTFTIRGVGSGRVAFLAVSGPATALKKLRVATSDLGNVKLLENHGDKLTEDTVYIRRLVITCEPSQPIEGVVVDRETKQPLAGFSVTSYGFLNEGPSHFVGQTDLKTTTDDNGRFRLEGMPKGQGNSIIVTAPTAGEFAQPYITQTADVPDATGIDPAQMTIEVQRGVWVAGQLTDQETSQPIVDAGIQYMPTDDNEAARKIDRGSQHLVQDTYGFRTDDQGRFRFVAVPGEAILGAWIFMDSTYPMGAGLEQLPDRQKANGRITSKYFRVPYSHTTSLKVVNVPDAGIENMKMTASKGNTVRVRTVDADGKPVSGVNVNYLPSLVTRHQKTTSPEFDASGFLPGKKRTLVLRHNERNIGAVVHMDSSEAGSPEFVTLQPLVSVTAIFVGADAAPVASVKPRFELLSDDGRRLQGMPGLYDVAPTNEKGEFSAKLPPGRYAYYVSADGVYTGYRKIEVVAGQDLDLGTVDVSQKQGDALPMMAPRDTDGDAQDDKRASTEKAYKEVFTAASDQTIFASVTDPVGNPAVDAEVGVYIYWRIEGGRKTVFEKVGSTRTDSSGKYEFTVPAKTYEKLVSQMKKPRGGYTAAGDATARGFVISANAPGFAPAWHRFEGKKPLGLDIQLVEANVPIQGQIVDLEGQPVSGVTVRPVRIDGLGSLLDWEIGKPVTTDGNGRFEFQHIGDNREVTLEINGAGIARSWVHARTKQQEPYVVEPEKTLFEVTQGFGAQPVISVDRGQSLIGRITDGRSGDPLSGVSVTAGFGVRKQVVQTDADGTYRIDGLVLPNAESQSLYVTVQAPDPEYFVTTLRVPDQPAAEDRYAPAELDFVLHPGKVIRGQLVDRSTGKGVSGTVMYYPKLDNAEATKFANFNPRVRSLQQNSRAITDENGRFSITVVDGEGLLAGRAFDKDLFKKAHGTAGVHRDEDTRQYFHLPGVDHFNQFHLIDIADDDKVIEPIKIRLRGEPAGNEGLQASAGQPSDDAMARMPRQTSAEGVDSMVRDTSVAETTEAPQPNKQALSDTDINGQVVDLEGRPVVDAKVSARWVQPLGKELADKWLEKLQYRKDYAYAHKLVLQPAKVKGHAVQVEAVTDKQGKFVISGLPADVLLNLQVEHASIAKQLFEVLNRDMPLIDFDPDFPVYGQQPVFVTQPAQPIVGTVTDAGTGKPIAGVMVYCDEHGHDTGVFGSRPAVKATTDENGRYQLLGVPKSDDLQLVAYPPKDQPYLIKEIQHASLDAGWEPVELDIALHRGIWITGQVVDKQTGEGVESEIRYLPLRNNPHLEDIEGFQTRHNSLNKANFFQHYQTDSQGNFRVVGLPGQAVLGAENRSKKYRSGAGYEALLKQVGSSYPQAKIETGLQYGYDLRNKKFIDTQYGHHSFRNYLSSSWIALDIPEDVDSVTHPLVMDTGHHVELQVLNPQNKPAESFEVRGVSRFTWLKRFSDGKAVLTHFGEDEVREIQIRDKDHALGIIADVKGTQPTTLRLKHYGKLRARLVNKQGQPLKQYHVQAVPGGVATTNSKGEFEITEMFADRKFRLEFSAPGTDDEHWSFFPDRETKTRETIDLGDINVDDLGGAIISGLAG